MEFSFTKEQEMIRKTVREFAEKEIAPIAADIDEAAEFPVQTIKKLGDLGFMGMTVPKEWGGAGMDDISYAIAVEELSRVCASHGVTMSVNNSLVCWPLLKFGSDAQKEKYLKPLASGKMLGCFGLTEPNAGTDAAQQTTVAVKKDDHYIINGSKIFITNGPAADIAKELVTVYGMSDALGPRTYGQREEMIFLGKEIHERRDYSEKTAEIIDKEVNQLIAQAGKTAKDLILKHKPILDAIATTLLEKETLEKEEFEALFQNTKNKV